MRNFWILFKYELKMQFPLRPQKGRRIDILGAVLSVLMVTLISAVIVAIFLSAPNFKGNKTHKKKKEVKADA